MPHTGLHIALYGHTQAIDTTALWRALIDQDNDITRCLNNQGMLQAACNGVVFDTTHALSVTVRFTFTRDGAGAVATHLDTDGHAWRQITLTATASDNSETSAIQAWLLVRALAGDEVAVDLLQIAEL